MTRIADVIAVLEDFAPLSIQEKWDNSGLCVGDPETEVKGILLGLDCSPALVDEAISCGANLIITHHPLIFNGIKKISREDPVGAAIIKAIRADVAVYSSHTPSDKVMAGVSGAMARKLGLENLEILEAEGDGSTGLGMVGDFREPMDCGDFIKKVKEAFHLKTLRCSAPIEGKVARVAMCGGAGSSLIGEAMAKGADAYLCGDLSYHHFFTPKGFMIMDVGHYESEIEIVEILFALIRKNFPTFAVRIVDNNYNPIFYF